MITAFIYLLIGIAVLLIGLEIIIIAFFYWKSIDNNGQDLEDATANFADRLSRMPADERDFLDSRFWIVAMYIVYRELRVEYKRLKELRG